MRPGELAGRIAGASAGVIAIAALATAVYSAWITREQQRMSVWPYITQINSDSGGQYNFLVRNAGLGPGLIRAFQLLYDGKPVRGWGEAVQRSGWRTPLSNAMYTDFGRGWVLMPGQRESLLMIPDSLERIRFRSQVLPHLSGIICYCSLFGECWSYETTQPEPQPGRCPVPQLHQITGY